MPKTRIPCRIFKRNIDTHTYRGVGSYQQMSFRHFHEKTAWVSEVFICIFQLTSYQTVFFSRNCRLFSFHKTRLLHLTWPNSTLFLFPTLPGNFHISMAILTCMSSMSLLNNAYFFTYNICRQFFQAVNRLPYCLAVL